MAAIQSFGASSPVDTVRSQDEFNAQIVCTTAIPGFTSAGLPEQDTRPDCVYSQRSTSESEASSTESVQGSEEQEPEQEAPLIDLQALIFTYLMSPGAPDPEDSMDASGLDMTTAASSPQSVNVSNSTDFNGVVNGHFEQTDVKSPVVQPHGLQIPPTPAATLSLNVAMLPVSGDQDRLAMPSPADFPRADITHDLPSPTNTFQQGLHGHAIYQNACQFQVKTSPPTSPLLTNQLQASAATSSPVKSKQEVSSSKPLTSYIAMIAQAVLGAPEERILLADIYKYIQNTYPHYKTAKSTWRSSVRHTLSTNECFVKNGRAPNGRGFYWTIEPVCVEDFRKGDFNRRQARHRVQTKNRQHAARQTSTHKTAQKNANLLPENDKLYRSTQDPTTQMKTPVVVADYVPMTTTVVAGGHPYWYMGLRQVPNVHSIPVAMVPYGH